MKSIPAFQRIEAADMRKIVDSMSESHSFYMAMESGGTIRLEARPRPGVITKNPLSLGYSLIVPVHVKTERQDAQNRDWITGIINNTTDAQIIIVNNGSTPEFNQWCAKLPNYVKVLFFEERLSYSEACNRGASVAACEWLCFMNSDVETWRGWERPFIDALSEKGVGVVGPSGRRLMGDWFGGNMVKSGRVDYVEGWCLWIRRDVFNTVRGWDEQYKEFFFEDCDICMSVAWITGLEIKAINNPSIKHVGGATINHYPHRHIPQQENLIKFRAKWEKVFSPERGFAQKREIVIGIVTRNQVILLEKALKTLFEKTIYKPYRVAVVCNACQDGTWDMLQAMAAQRDNLDIYLNEENEYFVKPNNFIISKYPEADILMLNNDIEIIQPDWLAVLRARAYSDDTVAAAGPMKVYPCGKLFEAGAHLEPNGRGPLYGCYKDPADPQFNIEKYVGYLGGCCLLLKRDAINRIGPLDETFAPMYYEESAWQYRAHELGLHSLYVPTSRIVHIGGATANNGHSQECKAYMEGNRKKFIKRFGKLLARGEAVL